MGQKEDVGSSHPGPDLIAAGQTLKGPGVADCGEFEVSLQTQACQACIVRACFRKARDRERTKKTIQPMGSRDSADRAQDERDATGT